MDYINKFIDNDVFPEAVQQLSTANLFIQELGSAEDVANTIGDVVHLVRTKNSNDIFIYDNEGYYTKAETWLLQAIVKYVLNSADYPWSTKIEKEVLGALLRDTTQVISAFNEQNAVNLKNGVFHFSSGRFVAGHKYEQYFNYILDYEYDKRADCPKFQKFIDEIMCSDQELITVVQELLGYCVSNSTDAEKAFFLYGNGCNGKSVLASVIRHLVGEELVSSISLEALSKQFGAAGLIEKRLNIAPENESLENSEKLKALVSCDNVNVPVKYKSDWVGQLPARHVFLMNNLPSTNDLSYGFFRKVLIVPFKYTVKPEDIDKELLSKLLAELPGILNWSYDGYKRLVSNEYVFSKSKKIEKIQKEYAECENPTGLFFHDTYESCPEQRVKKSNIYRSYVNWSAVNGYVPMNRTKFYMALSLKAEEESTVLVFRRIQGINYLIGYKEKPKTSDEEIFNEE